MTDFYDIFFNMLAIQKKCVNPIAEGRRKRYFVLASPFKGEDRRAAADEGGAKTQVAG